MDKRKTGRLVKAERRALGLSQAQFAELLGVSTQAVTKWECGMCMPSLDRIELITETLGLTIPEFFAGERMEEIKKLSEGRSSDLSENEKRGRKKNCLLGQLIHEPFFAVGIFVDLCLRAVVAPDTMLIWVIPLFMIWFLYLDVRCSPSQEQRSKYGRFLYNCFLKIKQRRKK